MKSVARFGCLVAMCSLLASGCGQSSSPPVASSDQVAAVPGRPAGGTCEAAVFDFLEAVRTGNDEAASRMLTPLAREKVAEQHLVVAPPGTDTARFTLGSVERLADDGARVTVNWTDLDEDGKPRTDQVTWMVRRVDEGWRIAGVAAPVFDGEPPLLLNFEDPEDMLRKQKMVRDEVRRRTEEAAGTPAQTPQAAAQSDPAVRR